MLRALVAALLVANVAFFAWSQGWLDGIVGARSIGDREPERLTRQVRPELVRILPPAAGSAAAATAPSPAASAPSAPIALACLEAGPFSEAELGTAQTAVRAALPTVDARSVKTELPGVWIVYMGRYANREALTKKEDELKRRKLPYEELRTHPTLAPGLSLGRFDTRSAALGALDQLTQQGVRTARVAELVTVKGATLLRIDQADEATASQAALLTLAPQGKGFTPCAKP